MKLHYAYNVRTGEYLTGVWTAPAQVQEFLDRTFTESSDKWIVTGVNIPDQAFRQLRIGVDINNQRVYLAESTSGAASKGSKELAQASTPAAREPEPARTDNTGPAWEKAAQEELGNKANLLVAYKTQLLATEKKLAEPNLDNQTIASQSGIAKALEREIAVLEERIGYLQAQMSPSEGAAPQQAAPATPTPVAPTKSSLLATKGVPSK